jgi:hypothetical protein
MSSLLCFHNGTWRPKAGIVKPEETCIARQRLGKHIPVATNTHAPIEEPVSKQRIGKHSVIRVLLETVLSVRSVQSGYKEEFSWEEIVEFRDASLQGYELGTRGRELSRVSGVGSCQVTMESSEFSWELKVQQWKEDFTCVVVQWYLECVIQWDCYSSCVKIRCQETDSGDCNRLRTLVCAAVNFALTSIIIYTIVENIVCCYGTRNHKIFNQVLIPRYISRACI